MPKLYNYKHPDGGWRQVQVLYTSSHGLRLVRDWHRGTAYLIPETVMPNEFYRVEKYKGPQP